MAAHLGLVLWATGRWREGWDLAEQALADGRPGITTRITASYVLGYIAMGRGEWERARQLLGGSLELGEPMGEILRTSLPLWGLAETALLTGDGRTALALSERGRATSAAVGDAALLFPFLVTGARAHLAVADPAGAEHWVDRLEVELRRVSIPGTLPAVDHARGLVLAATGATGRARDALDDAVRGWDAASRSGKAPGPSWTSPRSCSGSTASPQGSDWWRMSARSVTAWAVAQWWNERRSCCAPRERAMVKIEPCTPDGS